MWRNLGVRIQDKCNKNTGQTHHIAITKGKKYFVLFLVWTEDKEDNSNCIAIGETPPEVLRND